MSSLPPQLIASALQGTVQQHQSQNARQVAERRQSDVGQAVIRAGEQHETQIENTDADSQVNAEGGGVGSQGRAFSEHHQPSSEGTEADASGSSGITSDDDGQMHLDITA